MSEQPSETDEHQVSDVVPADEPSTTPATDAERAVDGVEPDPASPSTADAGPEGAPSTAEAEEAEPPRKLLLVAVVTVVGLVLDQLTKTWAQSALADGKIIDVVGSLRFNLLYNEGVAFSMGSGKGIGPYISLLALGVVLVVALGATSRSVLGATAAGLISGGALGNLGDRAFRGDKGFLHGAVVDFIDLQWWPVFNIADAAVVVGAGLLVVASFRAPR